MKLPASLATLVLIPALSATLSGCAAVGLRLFQPYRVELQQGNFVSREMVDQLRVGMTRDQVKFTLGSPMIASVFRNDRWDYPFYIRKTSGDIVERKFAVYFENDKLARWEGDEMPSELPKEPTAAAGTPGATAGGATETPRS